MNEPTKIVVGHPGPGQTGPTGPGPDDANWNIAHVDVLDGEENWGVAIYFKGEEKPDVFFGFPTAKDAVKFVKEMIEETGRRLDRPTVVRVKYRRLELEDGSTE
jgi:hypothetical protein